MDEKLTSQQIEEAVKVCGAKKTGGSGCFGCPLQGVSRCLNRLFDALVEERRWIPTAERLPSPDDGPYSTYEDVSAVSVLAMIEGAEWATELHFDGYDFFDIQGDEVIPYRVTHWKPMPKGPEVSHD